MRTCKSLSIAIAFCMLPAFHSAADEGLLVSSNDAAFQPDGNVGATIADPQATITIRKVGVPAPRL